nr:hypothetical protein [Bacteroidota bacterium]
MNKDWQNEKNHLERAIANTSLLINETRISKQSTLDDLTLINNQVSNRQKLVNSLIREQEMYKDTIFTLLLELDNLSNELEALKEEYTKLIYYANKNRNYYQRLLYIMAAEDFLQAYRRLNYFKQYATQRKEYVTLINEAEKKYSAKVGDLEKKVTLNQEILTRVKYELNNLDAAKALKSTAINNLGQKEKELVENQEKLQNDVDELNKKIEEIVAEEMSQASEN